MLLLVLKLFSLVNVDSLNWENMLRGFHNGESLVLRTE